MSELMIRACRLVPLVERELEGGDAVGQVVLDAAFEAVVEDHLDAGAGGVDLRGAVYRCANAVEVLAHVRGGGVPPEEWDNERAGPEAVAEGTGRLDTSLRELRHALGLAQAPGALRPRQKASRAVLAHG